MAAAAADPQVLPDVEFQPASDDAWPHLSNTQLYAMIGANVGSLIVCWFILRVVYPPPSPEEVKRQKQMNEDLERLRDNYMSTHTSVPIGTSGGKKATAAAASGDVSLQVTNSRGANGAASGAANAESDEKKGLLAGKAAVVECAEGESAGDYDKEWTETFDLQFVILMGLIFVGLCIWTTIEYPELWSNPMFWIEQLPKLAIMMAVSLFGGFLCRYFCPIDSKGYIITRKDSVFKVNYTRKLQHFAAYLVPLLLHTRAAASIRGPLTLSWGNFVTMLGFLVLIKPLRERFTFFMLQFNSLDRPEDRPNTLSWIVGGNILPGCVLIIFFRWVYSFTGQGDMSYIFLFITGIGDGLAEPVGIYLGKHKYWTASCMGDRRYQRSFEGSACVFISALVFTSAFYYTFHNVYQFWAAMIILPPLMAYVEATSPHTIDTPSLMGAGGITLWLISRITVGWH